MFVLKQLRRKKKINQTDLANAIGVSLRTIQLYEKKNANIPIKNLTKIARYFEVTIAEMYSHEVSEDESVYSLEVENAKKRYSVKAIHPQKQIIHVPLVTVENHKIYCENFQNEDFQNELPRISFMLEKIESHGNYMAFEIIGNSMENGTIDSIPNKAVVLGTKVSIENIFPHINSKNPLVILMYQENLLFKELKNYNKQKGVITCHSLNTSPEYSDFEISVLEIKQLFKIIRKQTN